MLLYRHANIGYGHIIGLMFTVQHVLLTSRPFHQWTAATKSWLIQRIGQPRVNNVDHYVLIYSSSTMQRNSPQLFKCWLLWTVSVHFLLFFTVCLLWLGAVM